MGLLLLTCGSIVGAGPTLSSSICAFVKQVVDSSFMLWQESISLCGSCSRKEKLTIPQIVGTVWDACSALKKTPATNISVAASMKKTPATNISIEGELSYKLLLLCRKLLQQISPLKASYHTSCCFYEVRLA
ncbi:hypothetical protein Droror1_Dr00011995 [Drosera rotundifolia]